MSLKDRLNSFHTRDDELEYGERMSYGYTLNLIADETPYELGSIAPASPPKGSEGTWFCYTITQGTQSMSGLRSGTAAEVQYFVQDMIEQLNERRRGKTRPRTKA